MNQVSHKKYDKSYHFRRPKKWAYLNIKKSNPSIVHLNHTFIHFLTGSQSADLESVAAEASDAFKENIYYSFRVISRLFKGQNSISLK